MPSSSHSRRHLRSSPRYSPYPGPPLRTATSHRPPPPPSPSPSPTPSPPPPPSPPQSPRVGLVGSQSVVYPYTVRQPHVVVPRAPAYISHWHYRAPKSYSFVVTVAKTSFLLDPEKRQKYHDYMRRVTGDPRRLPQKSDDMTPCHGLRGIQELEALQYPYSFSEMARFAQTHNYSMCLKRWACLSYPSNEGLEWLIKRQITKHGVYTRLPQPVYVDCCYNWHCDIDLDNKLAWIAQQEENRKKVLHKTIRGIHYRGMKESSLHHELDKLGVPRRFIKVKYYMEGEMDFREHYVEGCFSLVSEFEFKLNRNLAFLYNQGEQRNKINGDDRIIWF